MDVKTLFVADAVTTGFIGIALLYYCKSRKTYPGFKHWVAASLVLSVSYGATFLRGIIPELISILLVNGGFVLAGILRLDGSVRFLRGTVLNRLLYGMPLISMGTAAYFYLVYDDMSLRLLFLTVWTCSMLWWLGFIFFSHKPPTRLFHSVATGMCFLYGAMMLVRTVFYLMTPPNGLFQNTGFNSVFFIAVLIFEIWFGLLVMMMNNQRMEEALVASGKELKDRVAELEKLISEVKVLKGLLPICSSCKKIRDDKGYWNRLEDYIDAHSEATFTHGLCPECVLKFEKEICAMKERDNRRDR